MGNFKDLRSVVSMWDRIIDHIEYTYDEGKDQNDVFDAENVHIPKPKLGNLELPLGVSSLRRHMMMEIDLHRNRMTHNIDLSLYPVSRYMKKFIDTISGVFRHPTKGDIPMYSSIDSLPVDAFSKYIIKMVIEEDHRYLLFDSPQSFDVPGFYEVLQSNRHKDVFIIIDTGITQSPVYSDRPTMIADSIHREINRLYTERLGSCPEYTVSRSESCNSTIHWLVYDNSGMDREIWCELQNTRVTIDADQQMMSEGASMVSIGRGEGYDEFLCRDFMLNCYDGGIIEWPCSSGSAYYTGPVDEQGDHEEVFYESENKKYKLIGTKLIAEDIPTHEHVQGDVYESTYVRPIVVEDGSILAICSGMGTGKSRAVMNWIRENNPTRVICLTPRRMYAMSRIIELNGIEGQEKFVSYIGAENISSHNRIIMSMESLWKLADITSADLLILDESESLFTQLTSPTVTGLWQDIEDESRSRLMVKSLRTLEYLIKTSRVVVAADAFLTDRTTEILGDISGGRITVEKNVKKMFKRTVVKHDEKNEFLSCMLTDIMDNNKRIVAVFASKAEMMSVASELDKRGKKYLMYYGGCNKLGDVNKEWIQVDVVMYTPCITVGVNFDKEWFHRCYVYGASGGALARDIVQGTMRSRHLIDGELHLYISNCRWGRLDVQLNIPKDVSDEFKWMDRLLSYNQKELSRSRETYSKIIVEHFRQMGYILTTSCSERVSINVGRNVDLSMCIGSKILTSAERKLMNII